MVNPFGWLLKRRKKNKNKNGNGNGLREEELEAINNMIAVLKEVPLLSSLSSQQIEQMSAKFHLRTYQAGDDIMAAGEVGDEFFLINNGKAEVLRVNETTGEEQFIAALQNFDYFGEGALLNDAPRAATIRAVTNIEVLVLSRQQFQELSENNNIMFVARNAVVADEIVVDAPEENELAEEIVVFLKQAIRTDMLFENSDEEIVQEVAKYFFPREMQEGDVLISEGEKNGSEFFVIAEGTVAVSTEKDGAVAALSQGMCFGGLALLYNAPRNATVIAESNCIVYVMNRASYRYVVVNLAKREDSRHFEFLRSVSLFNGLLQQELCLLDMALVSRTCEPNEQIFEQGEEADNFYIVQKGTCEGTATKENGVTEQFVQAEGSFFGELALLNAEPRNATVVAGEEGCAVLQLSRDDFHQLLGPLQDIMERNAKEYEKPPNMRKLIGDDASKICDLEELVTIGLLGRGAFGKVTLVVDPKTKKSYALKAIKKTQIEELGQSSHIVNEKAVMIRMNNRFLVNLRKTYKDDWRVYFLVDVCLGGELFTILRKKRSFNEQYTQFYAGCVVEAFSYMHGMDIIYRDLKPENLVMDSNGYVKVTDFGFAKEVPKKTYTLCGTPDYLAPEIVTGQGHGKAVDWWCLGVLIYELLSSFPPFFDDEPMGTYRKIIQGKFKFPKYFTPESRDIIARLLRTKPTKRLAVMKGGADNIRNHMWYKGFDWEALRAGETTAPFIPQVKSIDDISNFDQRDKRATLPEQGNPPPTDWDKAF